MLRVFAFVVIQALFFVALAPPDCLAGEQSTQQATPPAPTQKQEIKTRSIHKSAPAGAAAPMATPPLGGSPRGDGGRPDDTIGGLPGHSPDVPARQP